MVCRIGVEAIPSLVQVAQRRGEHGPASFEQRADSLVGDTVLGHRGGQRLHPSRCVVGGRQLVVVQNHVVRDAEEAEQHRGHDAGAVLAGRAVEQQGSNRRVDRPLDDHAELGREPVEQVDVHGCEELVVPDRKLAQGDLLLCRAPVAARRRRGSLEQLDVDREAVGAGGPLHRVPEVEHHADAEAGDDLEVGIGQRVQLVGAEQAAGTDPAPVAAHVATQVAQVQVALQQDVSPLHADSIAGPAGVTKVTATRERARRVRSGAVARRWAAHARRSPTGHRG